MIIITIGVCMVMVVSLVSMNWDSILRPESRTRQCNWGSKCCAAIQRKKYWADDDLQVTRVALGRGFSFSKTIGFSGERLVRIVAGGPTEHINDSLWVLYYIQRKIDNFLIIVCILDQKMRSFISSEGQNGPNFDITTPGIHFSVPE